jgi:hypothetical protein
VPNLQVQLQRRENRETKPMRNCAEFAGAIEVARKLRNEANAKLCWICRRDCGGEKTAKRR